jgi:hypothetical protein
MAWVIAGLVMMVRGGGYEIVIGFLMFPAGLINLAAGAVWEGFTLGGAFPPVEDDKPETKPE